MIRTNKTIVTGIAGLSVVLASLGAAGYAAEAKSVPMKAVTPAGPKFEVYNPTTFKGKTGSIILPCEGRSMLLLRKFAANTLGDYLEVNGTGKSLAAPVGTYKIQYCMVTVPGKDGTTWSIIASGGGDQDRPIQVKSGKPITLPAIQQMAAATKSAKTGTITLPYEGQSNVLLLPSPSSKSSSYMQASCPSNKLTVPAGSYLINNFGCVVKDKDEVPWSITCNASSDQDAKVYEVKEGGDIKLDSCEPLTASVEAKQDGDKLSFNLALIDADGRKCTIRRADGKGEAPGFEVLSASGEVLMSGRFAYG